MLKLIVFDCDGVMFDSKKANTIYYNHLLDTFGHGPMGAEEVEYVHMHSVSSSVEQIFRHYPETSLEHVHNYRAKCGYDPFLQYMEMEPDLVTFLEITGSKVHLAISTNRTNTMIPLLKSYKLDHYFEKVVTAATAKRPKPAPDGLLEILDHFKCKPEETLFIGDSVIDEQHAAACNVPLIAFKSPSLKAQYHVKSFTQILQLAPFQHICP